MVHSFYSSAQPSGENVVVLNEVDALRRAGHEVALFAAHTDELEGEVFYKLRSGMRVATGYGSNPLKAINDFSPDIVHVHNLFPNYGNRWVRQLDAPLIHTLHNYRPLCAAGTLYRDGRTCTRCPDGDRWAATRYSCYRGSKMASALVNVGPSRGAEANVVLLEADRLILLSRLQHDLFIGAGLDAGRAVVAPNFLPDDLDSGRVPHRDRDGFVVIGRLTPEKGVAELLERWPDSRPLLVIGDGPLRRHLRPRGNNVRVVGQLPRLKVLEQLRASSGLVFPSRWFETFGLVYLEAISQSVPVFAFPGNAVAGMVSEDGTGIVGDWDVPLDRQLEGFLKGSEASTARCREVFDQTYSESSFVRQRQALYLDLA
jgi:glycosyltransferase involved in cell wall biosynthesis